MPGLAAVDFTTGIRVADPLPTRCSACLQAPSEGLRFVDYNAHVNRGAVVEEGSMAVVDSLDELYICESCHNRGSEALGFVPGLHRQHLARVRESDARAERWEAYAHQLEQALGDRPAAA